MGAINSTVLFAKLLSLSHSENTRKGFSRQGRKPGGRGTPLYKLNTGVCAGLKGIDFEPFWSENKYRF